MRTRDEEGGGRLVRVRGLTKSYGRVEVLKGVDLNVDRGQVYGFLGRNGAGKSTLIRILAGISRASGGDLELFGQPKTARDASVRRRIGYVAQDQNFYGWMTPKALGHFVGGFYPTWDAVEYARLCEVLELPLDRKLQAFSGGMKVKVALALALSHHPELLILDEPTAGLDPVARREFIRMVREQARTSQRTTFFSSHWVDEIEAAADTMGILEDGVMRYEGPLAEFSSRVRLFEALADIGSVQGAAPPEAPIEALVEAQSGVRVLQDRLLDDRREVVLWFDPGVAGKELADALSHHGWRERQQSLEDAFVDLVSLPKLGRG